MDLEHGLRTQRAVDDPRGLDDHAFDVEETFEYAVHQAFSVVRFFGRKTEYAETPPTLTKPTAQRRTHTHENSNSAFLCHDEEKAIRLVTCHGDVAETQLMSY